MMILVLPWRKSCYGMWPVENPGYEGVWFTQKLVEAIHGLETHTVVVGIHNLSVEDSVQ